MTAVYTLGWEQATIISKYIRKRLLRGTTSAKDYSLKSMESILERIHLKQNQIHTCETHTHMHNTHHTLISHNYKHCTHYQMMNPTIIARKCMTIVLGSTPM